MSRKNHKMIDGRLLQTNKKYSQLKMKQKEKIAEWMFQATRDYYMKKCTFPSDKHLEEVVDSVYEKIEDAEIWIPYGEVFKHYKSKRSDINKRVRKSLNEKEESRIEKVCFMNMCMIQDHKGNVLDLDKVNDSYTGTTFPGGHVEANEIFQKSMIREVWEETGLTVEAPKLGGLYHWHKSGVHYVITLYKADKFTGELKSSEEGRVYWIPLEELKTKELATGMEHVLRILESEKVDECYMHLEADGYVGDFSNCYCHNRIEGGFCHIPKDMNLFIVISLPDDTSFPLLQIRRFPANIQMMQSNQTILHVGTGTHLCC